MASGKASMAKPFSERTPNCLRSFSTAASWEKAHSSTEEIYHRSPNFSRTIFSNPRSTTSSFGARDESKTPMYSRLPWATWNEPVETSKKAAPHWSLSKVNPARKLFSFCSKSCSRKATPGVTNSVTPRLTNFLFSASFGSSSWSQTATL